MKRIYKNTLSLFALATLLLASSQISAQISFSNANDQLVSTDWHSGVAVGVVDMNGDQLDDILRLDQSQILTIEYQNPMGQFIPYTFGSVTTINQNQWAIAAADVNNDGMTDVVCGDRNESKIILSNSDGSDFTLSILPGNDFFAQGTNFTDINNDGFVDIFVCNDDAESRIWENAGDGTFDQADDWIDMATIPVSDNSGNYGSVWTDFDNDGDIDLYIAKCRQGVGDPSDPRRINALFVNDGNHNYTEQSIDFELKIGHQSWTSDFNDIDNDGDMDIFLTNHDFSNIVLVNDGAGSYKDISTGQNIGITTTNFPIQGVMRDFDNDGFMDILVSGTGHILYRNNGDNTFTEVNGLFDNNTMMSYALGDLNNDGFIDVYGSYGEIYTTPTNIDDVIWMNDTNDNNWFGVDLVGTVSNRQAIGARIEIYGPWGVQIREVRSGESYGIMNSIKQNFGLGDATGIEHVIVKWPSGIIDVIDNPTINEYVEIVEGACQPFSVDITADGETIICEGETVQLNAPAGYSYIWSNGSTASTITAAEAGYYNVVVEDLTTGCYGISQNIIVAFEEAQIPEIEVGGDLAFCEGGSVTLTAGGFNAYEWSTGETTQSITVTESGDYSVTIDGFCGSYSSEIYTVDVFNADAPVAENVETIPGPVTLTATGNAPRWYDAEVGGTLLNEGNTYEIPNLEATTTFWVEDVAEFAEPVEHSGQIDHSGSEYSGNQWNGGITFNAMSPFTINTVKVYSDTEGEREIELVDEFGQVIESIVVFIPDTGDDGLYITLDIEVPVGLNYTLSTNEDVNNNNFGYNSPRLRRSSQGVNYNDYSIEDVVNMTGASIGGTTRYYYFYDWEIQAASLFCQSERVPVTAEIGLSTYSIDESNEVQIYPNPTDGQVNLTLDFEQNTTVNLVITDLAGKDVYSEKVGNVNGTHNHEMNLSHLAKGIYLVKVMTSDHSYFGKIAIQ